MVIKDRRKNESIKKLKQNFYGVYLKRLGFRTYSEYLSSDYWKNKKQKYLRTMRLKECVICGDSKYILHHLSYKHMGFEYLKELVPLCKKHHKFVHSEIRRRNLRLDTGSLWVIADEIMPIKKYNHKQRFIILLVKYGIKKTQRANIDFDGAGIYYKGSKEHVAYNKKVEETEYGANSY